jgi:hypothetical protein
MASALIQERRTTSGNQPSMRRIIESTAQTFLAGTPLMLNTANGALQAWDGATIANGIAGIAKEFGANLSTAGSPLGSGVATPTTPGGALFVGGGQTFGSVPNEPAAVNFSRPYFNDGMTGIIVANLDTIFYAQVGPAQTWAVTDKGKQYGLTKDTDGHWFIDKTKTGVSAVAVVLDGDQYDTARGVLFQFLPSVFQLPA